MVMKSLQCIDIPGKILDQGGNKQILLERVAQPAFPVFFTHILQDLGAICVGDMIRAFFGTSV